MQLESVPSRAASPIRSAAAPARGTCVILFVLILPLVPNLDLGSVDARASAVRPGSAQARSVQARKCRTGSDPAAGGPEDLGSRNVSPDKRDAQPLGTPASRKEGVPVSPESSDGEASRQTEERSASSGSARKGE